MLSFDDGFGPIFLGHSNGTLWPRERLPVMKVPAWRPSDKPATTKDSDMLIRTDRSGFDHRVSSEITDRDVYEGRRALLRLMGTGIAGAAMATWGSRQALAQGGHVP